MSDPRWPDDGPTWPERDLNDEVDRNPWADEPESSGFDAEPSPPSPPSFETSLPPIDPWSPPQPEPDPEPWPELQIEPASASWPDPSPPIEPEPEPDAEAEAEAQPWPEPMPVTPPAAQPDDLAEARPAAAWSEPAPREPAPSEPAPWSEPTWRQPAADEPPEPAAPPAPTEPPVEPPLEAAEPTTAFGGGGWDPKHHGERRRATTAEQAVPWLIGVILALAGIVIVLLALIFTSPEGMLATSGSPSPTATLEGLLPTGSGNPSSGPRRSQGPASASPEATPAPTATPIPEYGPLEMVYLGRPSALEPIYLLRRDFSEDANADVLAQADIGISSFTWSPDGRVGAAIIGERLVAITPGESARALGDNVDAATFGWDANTLYAVRIGPDGGNDVARVVEIDFETAKATVVGSVRYPRPVIGADPALREAQFIDDGGLVRIYPVADGTLTLWVLGAPDTYRVDPTDGKVTEINRRPILWAPDGRQRIDLSENDNGTTDLILRDAEGDSVASVRVGGLVSHLRWVRSSNEVVFTLGRLGTSGGVRQDLYVWDLGDGNDPLPLTSNGVSFGAEWRGSPPNWLP